MTVTPVQDNLAARRTAIRGEPDGAGLRDHDIRGQRLRRSAIQTEAVRTDGPCHGTVPSDRTRARQPQRLGDLPGRTVKVETLAVQRAAADHQAEHQAEYHQDNDYF